MFSQIRPLLKVNLLQSVFRSCGNQANLESFLKSVNEKPLKQGYSLVFFDEEVQKLLRKITNVDLLKVFKSRPLHKKPNPPVYKLLTTEQLEYEMKLAEARAEYFLQIPPLVSVKEDEVEIMDSDTSLDGHDPHHSKHVFVDISHSKQNHNRAIVVREPNGVLRTALESERTRVNQVYFPVPGREFEVPKMFESENLIEVIKRKDYNFILDRACAQFEPNDAAYHRVITVTYEAINYCGDFEMLHSTRHFGSLAFYLITHKNMDKMLNDNILKERIDDAYALVKLYHLVHPKCKSAEVSSGKSDLEILRDYISLDSSDKNTLKRNLDFYISKEQSQSELKSEIKEAHGL